MLDCDQVSYDWQHYIPVIEKKPGALRNGASFAELPAPLLQSQEAVLVAVELVLESGVPSAEHVSNVLSRLKQTDAPAQVETTLRLSEEPEANTARYDRLSNIEMPHV
jgi:hypothetical protein